MNDGPVIELPDHRGRARPYRVTGLPPGRFEAAAWSFERLDRGGGSYRVSLDLFGRWRCECDWSKYHPNELCKHEGYMAKRKDDAAEIPPAAPAAPAAVPAPQPAAAPQTGGRHAPAAGREAKPPAVYAAIARVQKALSETGIAKSRKGQGFQFRGIDDVMQALSPLLVEAGLLILPRVTGRDSVERAAKSGNPLYFATVQVEYDFVAVADGSRHVVATVGEAMDVSDKASNKAMSAAYKYACFQAFCIPVEGAPDADAETHEVAAQAPAPRTVQPRPAPPTQHANGAAQPPDRTTWGKVLESEGRLVAQGLCATGDLQQALEADEALTFRWGTDAETWPAEAWPDVKAACVAFRDARQAAA